MARTALTVTTLGGPFAAIVADGADITFAAGDVSNGNYFQCTGNEVLVACTAILLSFVGKINGLLKTIPSAVLGGIMLLLFGLIASIGIKSLVESKTDFSKIRNQVIVSVILTVGIGGAVIEWGNFSLAGIGLGAVVGVILNLVIPQKK